MEEGLENICTTENHKYFHSVRLQGVVELVAPAILLLEDLIEDIQKLA